jgi:hypothetical protein
MTVERQWDHKVERNAKLGRVAKVAVRSSREMFSSTLVGGQTYSFNIELAMNLNSSENVKYSKLIFFCK